MNNVPEKYRPLYIYLALALSTLAVFSQVGTYDFINYDDPQYVSENRHVQSPLTSHNIIWAFKTNYAGNWHPLTWLSHMLDVQLFGLNPHLHHLTNLSFHLANTLLLFWLLKTMTASLWQSAFVAAAFALHPLHVESVAWIAERKDVLSTLFWLLTLAAYLKYLKRPAPAQYLLMLLMFALGLMAKPMLVTLPFVLLLLDFWPLGRLKNDKKVYYRLLIEKLPLFVLSALSCIITFIVQRTAGAVAKVDALPFKTRIANSFVAYLTYITKMLWPRRLAVFYPHPGESLPLWQPVIALLLLLGVSVLVLRLMSKYRYLLTGWFFFLGTLVPVIGLVQVGRQACADRYTYVPLTGLFIIIAWGLPDLLAGRRYRKIAIGILAPAVLLTLSVASFFQTRLWQNSFTLYTHTIKVTRPNSLILTNLGSYLQSKGRLVEAVNHYKKALQIKSNNSEAIYNLATALAEQKNLQQAEIYYRLTLKINPNHANAHYNLALLLKSKGNLDEAVTHFRQAIKLKPDFAEAHNNLANILASQQLLDDAVVHYRKALEINPDYIQARRNLQNALKAMKKSN